MNSTSRRTRHGLAFSFALATLGLSGFASAEECGDVTCGAGFVCNTYEYDCAAVSCLEGEECAPCEGGSVTSYSCDRAFCESDADCGGTMVCGTFQSFCADLEVACAEGENCAPPPDAADCASEEYQQCTARWELPCDTSADCGDGFDCAPYEICDCADAECTELNCHDSDEKICHQQQIGCSDASDCPADWTCEDNGIACELDAEGNEVCGPADPASACQPPWDKVYGPSSGGVILEAAAESGVAEDLPAGEPGAAADLGDEDVEESAGATPQEDNVAEEVEADIEEDNAADENVADVNKSPEDGGMNAAESGCTVATTPSNGLGGLGWVALALGLAFGARRRAAR